MKANWKKELSYMLLCTSVDFSRDPLALQIITWSSRAIIRLCISSIRFTTNETGSISQWTKSNDLTPHSTAWHSTTLSQYLYRWMSGSEMPIEWKLKFWYIYIECSSSIVQYWPSVDVNYRRVNVDNIQWHGKLRLHRWIHVWPDLCMHRRRSIL